MSVGVPPATVTASLEVERQRDGLAGIEVAARRVTPPATRSSACGVDLRAALGQAGEREVGGIAGAVGDGRRIEIDGGRGEGGGVLPGADGVAEGERIGAGAAGVGGGAAVVEGERRRAAGRTVTASFRLRVSVTVLPALRSPLAGDSASDVIVGVVVSICGPLWVRPVSERLAALPAPSVMVAELRLTAVAARPEVFCPAPRCS